MFTSLLLLLFSLIRLVVFIAMIVWDEGCESLSFIAYDYRCLWIGSRLLDCQNILTA